MEIGLKVKYQNKSKLDKFADAALKPCRYFFGGRKVTILDNALVSDEPVSSERKYWKTLRSIISFVPGFLVGSIAKLYLSKFDTKFKNAHEVVKNHYSKVKFIEEDVLKQETFSPVNMSRLKKNKNKFLCEDISKNEFEMNLQKFNELGGKVIFSPIPNSREGSSFKMQIHPLDELRPVCHMGKNRSQVMFYVMRAIKRKLGCEENDLRVIPPHGAINSYDLYVTNKKPFHKLYHNPMPGSREWVNFNTAIGHDRVSRIGTEVFKEKGSDRKNLEVRDWFTKNYYNLSEKNDQNKTVFLTFQKATSVVISRLIEANKDQPDVFKNVIVVGIPQDDTALDMSKDEEQIAEFKRYFANYTNLFDLEH